MKKLLLGLALAGLAFSCKSTAEVAATSVEACPPDCEMACCMEAAECEMSPSECAEKRAECSEMAAECAGKKAAECSADAAARSEQAACSQQKGAEVCPVTGKTLD